MRKSKRRAVVKATGRPAKLPPIPQQQSQPTPPHRKWTQAAVWVASAVITAMGLVATIASIWGPIWPTYPDVRPAGSDPGSPFSLPFSITNRSIIFGHGAAKTTCIVIQMKTMEDATLTNVRLGIWLPKEIGPAESANVSCGIRVPPNDVISVEMEISLEYRVRLLGFDLWHTTYLSKPFSWVRTSDGGRWIEGLPP